MVQHDDAEIPPAVLEAARRYGLQITTDLKAFDSSHFDEFAKASTPSELIEGVSRYCVQRFDRMARWLLPLSASQVPELNPIYEQNLDLVSEMTLNWATETMAGVPPRHREDELSGLRVKLHGRKLWWLAEATRQLSIRMPLDPGTMRAAIASAKNEFSEGEQSKDAASTVPTVAEGPKTYKTNLGRNVDRLRRECGLSFEDLEEKTGLDRKLIRGHVNDGKSAYPRTIKIYADTFTLLLDRRVTVNELMS